MIRNEAAAIFIIMLCSPILIDKFLITDKVKIIDNSDSFQMAVTIE